MTIIEKLDDKLQELETYIKYKDCISENVSESTVGWQIYHILKVINVVYNTLKLSDPNDYKKNFNKYKEKSFSLNSFPRGIADAPKAVVPPQTFSLEDLIEQLNLAKKRIDVFEALETNSNFTHPIFGQLNKEETQKFLEIHTEHHLKIIRDILKGQ